MKELHSLVRIHLSKLLNQLRELYFSRRAKKSNMIYVDNTKLSEDRRTLAEWWTEFSSSNGDIIKALIDRIPSCLVQLSYFYPNLLKNSLIVDFRKQYINRGRPSKSVQNSRWRSSIMCYTHSRSEYTIPH